MTAPRILGYKAVTAQLTSAYHDSLVSWAPPGGETSLPRVLCDGPEAAEHEGRGLHASRTLDGAKEYAARLWQGARSYQRLRVLILETRESDILAAHGDELRACRWRTVAILPASSLSVTPDPAWYPLRGMHGVEHAQRVLHWAWLIAGALALSHALDLAALSWAAALHDIGRKDDGPDPGHGARSAEMAGEIVPSGVSLELVRDLCTWHESRTPPRWTAELVALQDADALDLWRVFPPNPDRFHSDAARALYFHAKRAAQDGIMLLQEYS